MTLNRNNQDFAFLLLIKTHYDSCFISASFGQFIVDLVPCQKANHQLCAAIYCSKWKAPKWHWQYNSSPRFHSLDFKKWLKYDNQMLIVLLQVNLLAWITDSLSMCFNIIKTDGFFFLLFLSVCWKLKDSYNFCFSCIFFFVSISFENEASTCGEAHLLHPNRTHTYSICVLQKVNSHFYSISFTRSFYRTVCTAARERNVARCHATTLWPSIAAHTCESHSHIFESNADETGEIVFV